MPVITTNSFGWWSCVDRTLRGFEELFFRFTFDLRAGIEAMVSGGKRGCQVIDAERRERWLARGPLHMRAKQTIHKTNLIGDEKAENDADQA